ncbi:MAG: hypothetical protein OHK0029_08480 [Armatimonadaceae bacterium]
MEANSTMAGSLDSQLRALAEKHGFSPEAVQQVYESMSQSGGGLAQFRHADLGGNGQWMPGMTMIGKMGDSALKARVEALATDLANLVRSDATGSDRSNGGTGNGNLSEVKANAPWWSAGHEDWGIPSTAGSQNEMRYAYFGERDRVVIEHNGSLTVYDTTGYRITGASQQQSDDYGTMVFQTEQGPLPLSRLTEAE